MSSGLNEGALDVGKNSEYRFSRRSYYLKVCLVFLVVSVFFTISVVLIVEPPREPFGGIFDHTITGINGENIHLSQYHHKVILVVNVASTSSLTDVNYRGLQKLHDLYGKNGMYFS